MPQATTRPRGAGTPARAAVRATYAAFIGSGFAFANWAARIPDVSRDLHLGPALLGMVLLAIAAGSLIALSLAGVVVDRCGARRTVASMSAVLGSGFGVAGAGCLAGSVPLLAAGLFLIGFGNGAWDVAMNVHGAAVERVVARSIMPRFHAGFSTGTVLGAAVGLAATALSVPPGAHFLAVGAAVPVVVSCAVRGFLHSRGGEGAATTGALTHWREPRTLLVGLLVFAFAFAEGAGNDWISIALVDGHGATATGGVLGYTLFLVAMTTTRWFGTGVLDRFGRVTVVRALAVTAAAGLAVFIAGPALPVAGSALPAAYLGALLWGVGVSLGFPVAMSAAADEPAAAAGRVSVVASIGYCAFLAGPPAIGLVGERVGVLPTLGVVAALLVLAARLAGALRPAGEGR